MEEERKGKQRVRPIGKDKKRDETKKQRGKHVSGKDRREAREMEKEEEERL